ncbi:MAG TPA: hypothetical protein VEY91_00035, partial [Candidatus Limnocylindria bacterium]|nr:hypothetical protein [Candidatus Limnocylindria bacterium]
AIAFSALETCRVPVPVPIPVPRPRLGALGLPIAALLALGALMPAPAMAGWAGEDGTTADGRLIDVQVLVDGGPAPLYQTSRAHDRRYFQAFRGRSYALSVRNNSGRRVGVLIAVDGINVVNGNRSSLSRHEPMYVLDPYESTVIRGWRSSLHDVRKFVFVDEQRSYAERTGQANGDLGWIRVLAFNERVVRHPHIRPEVRGDDERDYDDSRNERRDADEGEARERSQEGLRKRGADGPAARAYGQAPAPESNPGTGWGERRWDPVRRTWFEAAARATDHMVLRYEYAAGLRALGIHPGRGRDRLRERERGELGFAQPPSW